VGLLGRSRRYSPLNRAHGLRRVPDEPIGLAFIASLVLHAGLAVSLIHLTDAPPQRSVADVSAILADLAAVAPASPPGPDAAPPAPADEQPVGNASIGTLAKATTAIDRPTGPTPEAAARLVTQSPAPPPASGPTPVTVPPVLPPMAPSEPAGSALDGPTLVAAAPTSIEVPDPAISRTFDIDTPLDAGWPEPPPAAFASPSPTQPARTLTSVPVLRQRVPDAPEPALAHLARETIPRPVPLDKPAVETTKSLTPATVSGVPTETPSPTPVAPHRSIFGLNRDSALVRLDGPRAWVTDQPTRTLTGTVLGGVPERLVVYVNGIPTEVVTPVGRAFETAVLLNSGLNTLRAVASGPAGIEAEDTITVQYAPRPSLNSIALTSPPDGLTLGPDDPPVAVVEGEIDDKAETTVWIVANDRRIPVTASAGRFRHFLLLPDPLVRLWAEAPGRDAVHRTGTVTIRTAGARPSSGVLLMHWPAGVDASAVEVTATWRAHSERLDTLVQTMKLPAVGEAANGAPSEMFHLRALKPGVYTLIVRYRGEPLGDARPTLYLPDKDHLSPRTLRPVPLSGGGRRVVAKVLMPQAILWSQDDWFSGTSESVDTVTKFRIPEGVTWVERKADLP
jgi:hypothetical protein